MSETKFLWEGEPDRLEFVDEATGFKCLIRRNSVGALCGYVITPDTLGENAKKKRADIESLDVHGGVTFMEFPITDEEISEIKERAIPYSPLGNISDETALEFYNKFYKDLENIEQQDNSYARSAIVGFDCCHYTDVMPQVYELLVKEDMATDPIEMGASYKDINFVETECRKLAKQLHELLT